MALSTEEKEELEAELVILNAQINKAYKAQSYSNEVGSTVRPDLALLLKRRTQIKKMLKGKRIQEVV